MRQIIDAPRVQALRQLVQAAGAAIMAIYEGSAAEEALLAHKADDSPLTLADLTAHRVLVNGLAQLTPDIPVVSEEDAASWVWRQPHGQFWLIDPLDGTKEFLARNGEFTVNLALIRDGVAVWGMVGAPAIEQLFWGGAGLGAWREKAGQPAPVQVAVRAQGQPCRVLASKSHLNAATSAFIERLGAVQLVQAGSSLKFCRMAEGHADVYPRLAPTCEWDTAAAQAVLEGAGGGVYTLTGEPLRYGKPDVLNPNFVAAAVPLSALPLVR